MRSRVCIEAAHNPAAAGPRVQIPPPQPKFLTPAVPYRVYVTQNGDARFYIGLSDDVVRRINQHNVGISRWTRGEGTLDIDMAE
jgi:hypothetical protein